MNHVTRHSKFGGDASNNPNLLVIHAMAEFISLDKAGSIYYADKGKDIQPGEYWAPDWLDKVGYSAHLLITPSGVAIKTRRTDQRAWHAGGHNTDSLGIEFMVPGVHDYMSFLKTIKTPYLTEAAYNIGLVEAKNIMAGFPISSVKRHSDLSPDRKKDPGTGFPKQFFIDIITD